MASSTSSEPDFSNTVGDLSTSKLTTRFEDALGLNTPTGIHDVKNLALEFQDTISNIQGPKLPYKLPPLLSMKEGDLFEIPGDDIDATLLAVHVDGSVKVKRPNPCRQYGMYDSMYLIQDYDINNFPSWLANIHEACMNIWHYKVWQENILKHSEPLLKALNTLVGSSGSDPSDGLEEVPVYDDRGKYKIRYNKAHFQAHSSAFRQWNLETIANNSTEENSPFIDQLLLKLTNTPVTEWMNKFSRKEFNSQTLADYYASDEKMEEGKEFVEMRVRHIKRQDRGENSVALRLIIEFCAVTEESSAPFAIGTTNKLTNIPIAYTKLAPREGRNVVSVMLQDEYKEHYLLKETNFIEMWVLYCAEGDTKVDLGPYRNPDLGEELVLTTIYPVTPPTILPDNVVEFMPSYPMEPHALLKGLHNGKCKFIWGLGPEEAIHAINRSMKLLTDGGMETFREVFVH